MTVLPVHRTSALSTAVVPAPPVTATSFATMGLVLSLLPTLLPRPAPMQAVLTALLVTTGIGLAGPVERVAGRLAPSLEDPQLRRSVFTIAAGVALGGLLLADEWLSHARRAVDLPPHTGAYWPLALGGAAVLTMVLVRAGRGVRGALRRITSPSGRVGMAACVVAPVLVVGAGAAPLVSALPLPGDDVGTLTRLAPTADGVRVYVGVDERETATARADLAVRRMERDGAFERAAVVLAFPTGTGWINPEAVDGFEAALGGDVATVAMQGGKAPSWVEMFLNRSAQEASAQAVFDAVTAHIDAMPAHRRPRLYLYGESLGALLGQQVMTQEGATDAVCGVLWAGVPGGDRLGLPNERMLSNADDPVVFWEPATAVRRPASWPDQTPWLPGLSYVTTSLDLVVSLGSEPGHGHVYGSEQSWRLPPCGSPVEDGIGAIDDV